jgi:hypothetical protein
MGIESRPETMAVVLCLRASLMSAALSMNERKCVSACVVPTLSRSMITSPMRKPFSTAMLETWTSKREARGLLDELHQRLRVLHA